MKQERRRNNTFLIETHFLIFPFSKSIWVLPIKDMERTDKNETQFHERARTREMRRMKGMITTRRMCGVMLNGDFAMERKQTTTGKIWEVE